MASLVEFVIKIKDLASGTVGKLASNADSSFMRMQRGISQVAGKFSTMSMSIRDIDNRLNSLRATREISVDGRQIRRLTKEIDELEKRRDRLDGKSSGGLGSSLRGLAAGAMIFAGATGVGSVIGAGMDRQMTNKRFEVMTDQKTGQQMSGNLSSFAKDTIYGNEVFGIAQTMLSFGVQAKGIMPSIQKLGDIAGGDSERFKSLGLVFSQVAATGRLMGQDLLQFVNAGFNPLQIISEKTGKSMAVLKKEMEEGKISFADVAGAIETATGKGGRFYQMTAQLAETGPGKILALQGSIEGLMASIGSSMLDHMGPLIDMAQYLVNFPELIIGIAAAFGAYSIAANFAAIKTAILNFVMSINPIGLIVMGIVALIVLIVHLVKKYDGWGKAMSSLWAVIKGFFVNVGISSKDFFQEFIYRLEMVWLKTKNTFQYIMGAIHNFINALNLATQGKFADAKQALTAEIKTTASAQIVELEKKRGEQRKQNMADLAQGVRDIKNNWAGVKLTKAKSTKSAEEIGATSGSLASLTGAPSSLEASNKGITAGGSKYLNIHIGKFQDKTEIHTTTLREGTREVEDILMEMFLRITNSGGAAIS